MRAPGSDAVPGAEDLGPAGGAERDEADRHRVNALNGEWTGSVLYLPDGTEMVFTPGMSITLEVSAPGFMTKIVNYDIRKRKNRVEVALPTLVVDESGIDEPIITFGRDKPRDGE